MVDVPPEAYSFIWLYTWPAASTLNVKVDSSIPFVRKTHDFSLGLTYGEAKRRAHDHDHPHHLLHSATRGIARRSRYRQRKACPKAASPGLTLRLLPVLTSNSVLFREIVVSYSG